MALIFKPVLCEAIIAGSKTMTRRPLKDGKHPYEVGQRHAVLPGMARHGIATIEVTAVRVERLDDITNEDGKAEGFDGRLEFFAYWSELYDGPFVGATPVAVVEFELIEVTAGICPCCGGEPVKGPFGIPRSLME